MSSIKLPITLIIPAFNEAEHIRSVLDEVVPLVESVIVVDDGSRDGTADISNRTEAVVLRHLVNRGQGAALRTGTDYAVMNDSRIIVHYDADGQFRSADLSRMIEPILKDEADMVFGSRFLDNSTKMPFTKKHFIMPLARFINRIFFGLDMTDPQSGFRAFSYKAVKEINWQQDGMAHCSEILYLAHKNSLRIKEVPITIIYNEYGQRLSGGFKIIKDLFIARLLN